MIVKRRSVRADACEPRPATIASVGTTRDERGWRLCAEGEESKNEGEKETRRCPCTISLVSALSVPTDRQTSCRSARYKNKSKNCFVPLDRDRQIDCGRQVLQVKTPFHKIVFWLPRFPLPLSALLWNAQWTWGSLLDFIQRMQISKRRL